MNVHTKLVMGGGGGGGGGGIIDVQKGIHFAILRRRPKFGKRNLK